MCTVVTGDWRECYCDYLIKPASSVSALSADSRWDCNSQSWLQDAVLVHHQLIHSHKLGSVFNICNNILSPSHFSQNCKRISKREAMEDIGNITLWADVPAWNFRILLHFKDVFCRRAITKWGDRAIMKWRKVRDEECQHVVVVWEREIWQDSWYLLWSQTMSRLEVMPGAQPRLFTKFWRETWIF